MKVSRSPQDIATAKRQIQGRTKPNDTATVNLALQMQALGWMPAAEFRFSTERRWRFDLALIADRFAIEVDGGGFVAGRHSRGTGIEKDCEKYAEAMCLGWKVLRVTPRQVKSGAALAWIERLVKRGSDDDGR